MTATCTVTAITCFYCAAPFPVPSPRPKAPRCPSCGREPPEVVL